MMLPVDQREALVLIGAGGLSYEEGAAICGCAVGTMKSRVSRARAALQDILEGGEMPLRCEDELPATDAFAAIMGQVDDLHANGLPGHWAAWDTSRARYCPYSGRNARRRHRPTIQADSSDGNR